MTRNHVVMRNFNTPKKFNNLLFYACPSVAFLNDFQLQTIHVKYTSAIFFVMDNCKKIYAHSKNIYHIQARMTERFLNTRNLNRSIIVYFLLAGVFSSFLFFSAISSKTSPGNSMLLNLTILVTTSSAFSNRFCAINQRNDSGRNLQ